VLGETFIHASEVEVLGGEEVQRIVEPLGVVVLDEVGNQASCIIEVREGSPPRALLVPGRDASVRTCRRLHLRIVVLQ
jgi:hypothetical protein